MSALVRVLVAAGFGINCQEELAAAWRLAGAAPEIVHLNELLCGRRRLAEFNVFCLPGGFSFGDDLGSGKVLAGRLRFRRLPDGRRFFDELTAFIAAGGCVIGICNGFQVLVKLGLLPDLGGGHEQEVSLAPNDSGRFEDRWVRLGADAAALARHPWLEAVARLDLPVRHGEGKLVVRDPQIMAALEQGGAILWRYVDADGVPTAAYPTNPNGSAGQVAALADRTGRVIGMMPHPEAFLHASLHPDWAGQSWRGDSRSEEGDGFRVFQALVGHITAIQAGLPENQAGFGNPDMDQHQRTSGDIALENERN
jgi:phosphoribosylformylglycinamidine synthase subunit PurQ / glutaminase